MTVTTTLYADNWSSGLGASQILSPRAVAASDLLGIVYFCDSSAATPGTPSDNLNGAWTTKTIEAGGPQAYLSTSDSFGNPMRMAVAYKKNSAAGNVTVTCPWVGGTGQERKAAYLFVVSGLGGGGDIDQCFGAVYSAITGTTITAGTFGTFPQANTACVTAYQGSQADTSIFSGWTRAADMSPFLELRAGHEVSPSTTGLVPGWNKASAGFYGITAAVSFKDAGAPPDATPPNITSTGTGSTNGPFAANVAENSTAAFITLTSDEALSSVTKGGADGALFTLAGSGLTRTLAPTSAFNSASLPHSNPFVVTLGFADTAGTPNVTTVTVNVTVTSVNTPTLTLPTRSTPTATTAAPGFTTDAATGTAAGILIAATSVPTTPSAAQVKAGQNSAGTGTGVTALTALTITSAGAKTFAPATVATGLTYYPFVVHTAGGIDSVVQAGLPHYPGTGRPAGDVTVAGWTGSAAGPLAALLSEDTASDAEFITSPALSATASVAKFALDKSYPAGTYSLRVRASVDAGTGTLRVRMLDGADVSQGVTANQALTTTPTTYTLSVTITGAATRVQLEVEA